MPSSTGSKLQLSLPVDASGSLRDSLADESSTDARNANRPPELATSELEQEKHYDKIAAAYDRHYSDLSSCEETRC